MNLLERLFHVRPEERRIVLLFFGFFVGVGMFYTVGATVGDTLFLSHLPPAEVPRMLPLVYLGIAGANVLSTLAFDAVQARVSRTNSIVGLQIVLGASVLVARSAVEAGFGPVYLGLVIWLEVCALLSITLFYSFAGDYFAPRDARRLYGLIAGGMSLGTVLAGYGIHACVGLIGTKNLLYVGAALLLCNAAIAGLIYRVGTPVTSEAFYADEQEEQVSLRTIASRPYVRLLAVMIPLATIVYVTVDYQMKWLASTKSEQALAEFFGSFYGWVGVAQVTFQLALAQRILQRLGVINALVISPFAIGVASAVLYGGSLLGGALASALLLSAGVNFMRMTLAETLDLPSRELLLLPLPTRFRRRVQPLMSGALAPGAQGLAAVVLLVALRMEQRPQALSLVVLGCCGLLVLTLLRLRPRYRETLAATLQDHQLDSTDLERLLQDPTAERLIESLLRSADAELAKATIDLLAGRKLGRLGPVLDALVDSSDADLAIAALQRLSEDESADSRRAIARAWESPLARVRQAAVLALCRARGEHAVEEVRPALQSQDPELRASAIIGLARHGGERGRALVRPSLQAQSGDRSAEERVEAARMLGRIGGVDFADLIAPLLRDEAREVRAAATEACREVGDPALIEPLLGAVREPELRTAALRALAHMPAGAANALAHWLDAGERPLSERCAMAGVLGQIGGAAATSALYAHVDAPHEISLRLAAAEALRAMRARAALPALQLADYESLIDRVCGALELLQRGAMEVSVSNPFVTAILRDHGRLHVELLCALLALRYDPRTIDRIQYNVCGEPREIGTRALELVEEVLPRRLAPQVVRALQVWLDHDASRQGGLSAATQDALLAAEPWVRVATVHHLNQGAAYPTIEAGTLSDQDRELYRLLDVVSFLKRVPLLADLSAYHLLEQAEIAEWRARSAGETLFRQGDRGEALYIVCQGEVEVRLGEKAIAKLGPGECIGELALLDGEPRSAGAVAVTDTTLLEVPSDRFRHLLLSQPQAARALLRTLDRRIRDTQHTGQTPPGDDAGPPMRRSQLMRAQKLGLTQLVSSMSFLKQIDLFRDLATPALADLAGIAQEIAVYRGDTLFEEGDVGESLYLVCSGSIAISSGERQLAVLERNACLGEMALISGLPRSATATALADGRLLRLGSDDFASLLASQPEIALALLRTLAGRLRAALKRRQEAR